MNFQIWSQVDAQGGKDVFYILDTLRVDNTYLIKFSTPEGSGNIYIFDSSLEDIDSILESHDWDFNKLIDDGYYVKLTGELWSFISNSSNLDKQINLEKYYTNSNEAYEFEIVKEVLEQGNRIQVLAFKCNCYLIALISQHYYNRRVNSDITLIGGDMKFIRIVFPILCN
ncbi:MAG: hypothetical protein WAU21_08535 [Chitinophagales bacterium]|nr:hypothetical protein [Bacteroidota bacterium]MBK8488306.1 hypothetical protein [Bacteroidota bacterium]MBK8681924.1 hypothetical protein [Bacteroidota bacterium]